MTDELLSRLLALSAELVDPNGFQGNPEEANETLEACADHLDMDTESRWWRLEPSLLGLNG